MKRITKKQVNEAAARLQRTRQNYHPNDLTVVRAEIAYQEIKDAQAAQQAKSDMIQKIGSDDGEPMTVLSGYDIAQSGAVIRGVIDVHKSGDYGCDPIGDGTYKMFPSGDIVDSVERDKRLRSRGDK